MVCKNCGNEVYGFTVICPNCHKEPSKSTKGPVGGPIEELIEEPYEKPIKTSEDVSLELLKVISYSLGKLQGDVRFFKIVYLASIALAVIVGIITLLAEL